MIGINKLMLKRALLATLTLLIIFPSFMQSSVYNVPANNIGLQISENNIKEYIGRLQSFGTRYSFSNNSSLAAEWLFNKFFEFGLYVKYDEFVYRDAAMRNVVATLNGSSASIFVIGAHYDSVNIMDAVKSINDANAPAPGANDDASGVAVVLECARVLANYKTNATVMFVAFGCEEQGMVGSEAFAQKLASENKTVIGMINLDMVGYPHNSNLTLTYNSNSEWLANAVENISQAYFNFNILKYLDEWAVCDQRPFWKRSISALLISEDYYKNLWNFSYPYIHSANDTSDKLNFSFIANVATLCIFTILQITALPDLEVRDIEFPTLQPYCGENITVFIIIRNYGGATNATLKIYHYYYGSGKLIHHKNISVDAYATKVLSFNYTFLTTGRHLVYTVIENSTCAEINVLNNVRYKIIECASSKKIATAPYLIIWLALFIMLALTLSFFVRVYSSI
ncbi:MAG: M20/M25/M40 family metallo-hydrolase [Candidatus Thermoplasmatota archaeon]